MITLLSEKGADVNARENYSGMTMIKFTWLSKGNIVKLLSYCWTRMLM